jgi:hypothetical protein
MKIISKRKFLSFSALGAFAACQRATVRSEPANYLKPLQAGRTFTSLDDAKRAKPGDLLLIRGMEQLAQQGVWSREKTRGKWHLRPYELADRQAGNLLMINDRAKDEGSSAVPPVFEVSSICPDGILSGLVSLE